MDLAFSELGVDDGAYVGACDDSQQLHLPCPSVHLDLYEVAREVRRAAGLPVAVHGSYGAQVLVAHGVRELLVGDLAALYSLGVYDGLIPLLVISEF